MSTTMSFYAIDGNKLRNTIGSNDQAFIQDIRESSNDWLDESDVDLEAGEVSSESVLKFLVTGNLSSCDGDELIRALELVCEQIGIRIPTVEFEDIHLQCGRLFSELEVANDFIASPLPFAFPHGLDFHVCYSACHSLQRMLEKCQSMTDIPVGPIRSMRIAFAEVLEATIELDKDLIAFQK